MADLEAQLETSGRVNGGAPVAVCKAQEAQPDYYQQHQSGAMSEEAGHRTRGSARQLQQPGLTVCAQCEVWGKRVSEVETKLATDDERFQNARAQVHALLLLLQDMPHQLTAVSQEIQVRPTQMPSHQVSCSRARALFLCTREGIRSVYVGWAAGNCRDQDTQSRPG